jgi:hypothetical protein
MLVGPVARNRPIRDRPGRCRVARGIGLIVVAVAALAGAGSASAADSGYSGTLTITSVLPPTASTSVYVQGSYSVTHSCTAPPGDFTYCGYFLTASTVPQGVACRPDTTKWVQSGIYDHSQGQLPQSGSVYWTDYATSSAQPRTACLYNDDNVLIAQANYTIPGTASPSTSTAPSSTTPSAGVAPLTISDARANLNGALRQKFGGRFASHRNFKRSCYRLTSQKVRCRVRWDHGQWRYSGAVDLRNDPDDPDGAILFSTTIRRQRLHTRAPKRSSAGPSGGSGRGPAKSSCDRNYSGACLNPNASDYDCAGGSGNGPFYVQGPISVVGTDHYDLDADGDGVACES